MVSGVDFSGVVHFSGRFSLGIHIIIVLCYSIRLMDVQPLGFLEVCWFILLLFYPHHSWVFNSVIFYYWKIQLALERYLEYSFLGCWQSFPYLSIWSGYHISYHHMLFLVLLSSVALWIYVSSIQLYFLFVSNA